LHLGESGGRGSPTGEGQQKSRTYPTNNGTDPAKTEINQKHGMYLTKIRMYPTKIGNDPSNSRLKCGLNQQTWECRLQKKGFSMV
jgi:hypothetical protein